MASIIVLLNESGRWLVTQLGRMSVELAILAGIVLIVLYVLRVKSPALRHLFWGLLLAKPVVTFLVASPLSLYGFLWPTMPEVFYMPIHAPAQVEITPLEPPVQTVFVPEAPPMEPPRPETPSFWRQIDRYGLISALWALVASLFGLRLLLGCAYVSFLRSTAQTQREGPLASLVAEAERPLRMRRRVRIATTRVAHGPVLAGIFRPVILLPEHMAEALTPKQMKLVITHELAHARRWDNLVLLIQRLAEMFFFFHPVVWFCGWMMRREAEAACDDMVVSAYGDADGAGAAAYADSLTRVAEMKCGVTRRLLVNTFAAAESNFHRRVRRILSGRRTRMTLWLSLATGAALIVIGILGLPTVSSAPQQNGASDDPVVVTAAKEAVEAKWDDIQSFTAVIESINNGDEIRGPFSMFSRIWALKNAEGMLMYRVEIEQIDFENPDRKGFDKFLKVFDGKDEYREMNSEEGIEVKVRRDADKTVTEFGIGIVGMRSNFEECFKNETFTLLPDEEIDGKPVYVFEGQPKRSEKLSKYRLYIDKETGVELKYERGKKRSILSDVKLNGPVDASLFNYTPPEGAKIIDNDNPETQGVASSVQSEGEVAPALSSSTVTQPGNPAAETPDVPAQSSDTTGDVPPALTETSPGWREDFENYTSGTGTWPDTWIADGNASNHDVCYVDGSTFSSSHGNVLRLHGDTPAWSPLAYFVTRMDMPFQIAFDVYLESPEPNCTCVVGLRKKPDWRSPGVLLFDAPLSGEVKGLEPVADGGVVSQGQSTGQLHLEQAQWYHVELTVQEKPGRQTLAITLSTGANTQGPVQFSVDTILVTDMPYLQLEVRSGTAWFDNISMAPAQAAQTESVMSGPFRVAPLAGYLDEATKQDWAAQGITGGPAIVKKLQEVTLETMRKRLDSASLQHVTLRKMANGRIAMDLPPGKEGERVAQIALQPGQVSFCAAASKDETLEILTNAEKEPRFQGRIETWIDRNPKQGNLSVAEDQRDAAKAVLAELESVLPDKKRFMLGSRQDPNALYLIDFNTAMTNVKVRSAIAAPDHNDPGRSMILMALSDEDARRFGDLTQSLIAKSLALLVDSEIQTVPTVRDRITNGIQIVGNYTPEEAADLAARLSSPGYPVPLAFLPGPEETSEALEERTYENINEAVFDRIKTHLLPIYDPDTGEELSTLSYDKASSRLIVRNLPDNLAWFEKLLGHLGLQGSPPVDEVPAQTGEGTGKEEMHPGKISGRVEDAEGRAIHDAYVGVGDCGDSGGSNHDRHRQEGLYAQGKTDDAGQFTLNGLALGREHLLIVTHPDFVREERVFKQDTADSITPFRITMKPAAKIIATVVDANDAPVGDAVPGKYFFWLEALDGHKFIPPGHDPHLTSFASSLWLESQTGDSFSFSELAAGEYSVNVLREVPVAPTDEAMAAENTAVTVTYHGGISSITVKNGQKEAIRIAPIEYGTRASIGIPNMPDIPATVPRILAITRDPAFTAPGGAGIPTVRTLEDPQLMIFAQGVFYNSYLSGELFMAKDRSHRFCTFVNLPPGRYCVLGGAPMTLTGALLDLLPNREEVIELGPNPGPREKGSARTPYRKIDPQGGKVVDGLQAVLQMEKKQWVAGETPAFRVDLLEVGEGSLGIDDPPLGMVLEYDGVQYTVNNAGMMSVPGLFGRGVYGLQGTLDGEFIDAEKRSLTLTHGMHTIRVAFHTHLPRRGEGETILIFSNPVTIEVSGDVVPGSTGTTPGQPEGILPDLDQLAEGVPAGVPDANQYNAFVEFRLYVAHGAVTQKGNPLPDDWEGKLYRPLLRVLLTSATEADAYAVSGTPLVMDGNTLTWAGNETPDPGCATLAASSSFMMRRDESTNLTISMPPEAGLPASIQNEAEMKVVCQLINKNEIRLWVTTPQPAEVSTVDRNTWTNVAATAPHDTWQLMVIDPLNEKNESQNPLLLCWKLRYGMEQDLKRITPPATVGNVSISQSPAYEMPHVPQYVTEARILSGPVEAIERFVNTLETLEEARVTPENTRTFRMSGKTEIQALLETTEKQVPGLKLLSGPRICMRSAEDMAKVEEDKIPKPIFPSKPGSLQELFSSSQNRFVLKGWIPQEFWQKNMGPYSASLVNFLQGEQCPGVIADMTTEYSSEPGIPEPVPTRAGIAVAMSLHKTDDPQVIDLRLYFNSKEREPNGFFESPVTLATPFPLGQCMGFVTENRNPEKKTLVLLTLEQVNSSAIYNENQ